MASADKQRKIEKERTKEKERKREKVMGTRSERSGRTKSCWLSQAEISMLLRWEPVSFFVAAKHHGQPIDFT
jgi:hypothetical protein